MWDMRTVQVIPVAVGSLGSVRVTKNLDKCLEKLDIYAIKNSKDFKERFRVID